MVLTPSWVNAQWLFRPSLLQQRTSLRRSLVLVRTQEFHQQLLPKSLMYVVATNAASSFDSTVFHAFLMCSVPVCEPGNEAIALSESTYCEKMFVGSPNPTPKIYLHENLKHENFMTRKFPDLWYVLYMYTYTVCSIQCTWFSWSNMRNGYQKVVVRFYSYQGCIIHKEVVFQCVLHYWFLALGTCTSTVLMHGILHVHV